MNRHIQDCCDSGPCLISCIKQQEAEESKEERDGDIVKWIVTEIVKRENEEKRKNIKRKWRVGRDKSIYWLYFIFTRELKKAKRAYHSAEHYRLMFKYLVEISAMSEMSSYLKRLLWIVWPMVL